MIEREHHYQVNVKWTGNKGNGTQSYKDYERNYEISEGGKPVILGSSDPHFWAMPNVGIWRTCSLLLLQHAINYGICISARKQG